MIPAAKEVTEHWTEQTEALRKRLVDVSSVVKRFGDNHQTIESEEQQAQAADVVAQAKKHLAATEDQREKAKRPWLDGGKAVDTLFKSLTALVGPTTKIERMQTVFAKKLEDRNRAIAEETARRAQVEADRLLEEAAQRLEPEKLDAAEEAATHAAHATAIANARPSEHSKVVSDYNTTASLGGKWVISCDDKDLVPSKYLTFNESAVRQDFLAAKKEGRPFKIPGVSIQWEAAIRNYAAR